MINLPKRKSTFNFFESFSDLVFCTLVMFLVLVLFLAMNVNQKQEQVADEKEVVSQTRAEIDQTKKETLADLAKQKRLKEEAQTVFDQEMSRVEAQRKKLIAQAQLQIDAQRQRFEADRAQVERELSSRRKALGVMEAEVDRQLRVYEQALGTNRFTGLPAKPRLVVAYDWQPTKIGIHTVPAWFVDELNTTPPGLTGQPLADYFTKQRARFVALAKEVEPLSPRQYRALIRAISIGLEPVPRVGGVDRVALDLEFAIDALGQPTTQVALVIPGGNGGAAGVKVGDTLIGLGDDSVTHENLPGLLSGFSPGDEARLLVRRQSKPVVVALTFRELRVVDLVEAYRTDLSLVISGAKDTDYTDLWEKARADALRLRLQQGLASDAVWQGQSRWEGRESVQGRPVLAFDSVPGSDEVVIGEQSFSFAQFRRVLEALGGGGIVVEYEAKQGPKELPEALYEQVLRPTGFVIRAPQLEKLLEQVDSE